MGKFYILRSKCLRTCIIHIWFFSIGITLSSEENGVRYPYIAFTLGTPKKRNSFSVNSRLRWATNKTIDATA